MTHQFHYQIKYLANFVVRSVTLFKRVCRNGEVARRQPEAVEERPHLCWLCICQNNSRIQRYQTYCRWHKQCIKLLLRVLFNSPPGCIRKVADKNVYLWLTVRPKHRFQLPKKEACSAGNFQVVSLLFLMGETWFFNGEPI